MALTAKQRRFVAEYLIDLNGCEAAIRCGYAPKAAASQASRLLTDVNILAAVELGKRKQLEKADLTATRVLEELRRLVFSNVQDLFDEVGNLKPIQDLTREQAASIASLEVIKKNAEAGDGHIDVVHKIKVWDKTRSLELAAKHFKLLTDVLRIEDTNELVNRIAAARKRLSA
jgi:phage terminase small subunit